MAGDPVSTPLALGGMTALELFAPETAAALGMGAAGSIPWAAALPPIEGAGAGIGLGMGAANAPFSMATLLKNAQLMGQGADLMGGGNQSQPQMIQGDTGGAGGNPNAQMPPLGDAERQALLRLLMQRYGMGMGTSPVMRGL